MPPDLLLVIDTIYKPCGLVFTELKPEEESAEYDAFTFKINNQSIKYRAAKITPTKTGQFVTIWKRNGKGPIEPFHISDDWDLVIISTRNDNKLGQFIFPKHTLYNKGIVSGNEKEGKRGIRVYPPWDKAVNKQAEKTQKWQLDYFIDFTNKNDIDIAKLQQLLFNAIPSLFLP